MALALALLLSEAPTKLLSLTFIDVLILILYFVMILGIGFYLKSYTTTSEDFFMAGRSMTAWVAGLSFLAANLGSLELMGWAAAAYQYGILATHWYWIGAIPAMLFLGIVMMPFYYISKTHSVPGYLKLRYGEPARVLSAVTFGVMTVMMSGINIYSMALVMKAILGWNINYSIWISSLTVAAYVVLGGLRSAIFNEVLQFVLIWLGAMLIPVIGLVETGGWGGMVARIHQNFPDGNYTHLWSTLGHFSDNPMGVHWTGIVLGLGFVISFGYWTTDFLVVQSVLTARDLRSAKMAPIIGASFKMIVPFIVILPGLLGLAIFSGDHRLVGESQAVATGLHSYNEVLPLMLARYCGPGLLGLGITALPRGFYVRHGWKCKRVRHCVDLRYLSPATSQGRTRLALSEHGALVHRARRSDQHRHRLFRDAISEHHGLRASALQFFYCAAFRYCYFGHALEAHNFRRRILGLAGRHALLGRNVAVGENRSARAHLHRAFTKSTRHGGKYVSRTLVMDYLRRRYGDYQPDDQTKTCCRIGWTRLRLHRDSV